MKKVYVGNLNWSVDNKMLGEFFGQVGVVMTAVVILDRDTGRSRGFGFVEYTTEDEAKKAIEKMDGIAFEKRNVVVKEALPEGTRPDLRS